MLQFVLKSFEELNSLELYNVLQLRADVFVLEQKCLYQDCDDKDQLSMHLMGYENDNLVAYCRILKPGLSYDGYSAIGRVVTHPMFRNKKYGIDLMKKAIQFCLDNYSESIKISAQAYLETFYTNLGFQIVSAPYLEDDIPHIAMVLKRNEI